MKNILIQSILLLAFFVSIIMLISLIKLAQLQRKSRTTIITMSATFILTTSKTLIKKLIAIIQYVISLVNEEQRGFSKNISVYIEKIDFVKHEDNE